MNNFLIELNNGEISVNLYRTAEDAKAECIRRAVRKTLLSEQEVTKRFDREKGISEKGYQFFCGRVGRGGGAVDRYEQLLADSYEEALTRRASNLKNGIRDRMFSSTVKVWHGDGSCFLFRNSSHHLPEGEELLFVYSEHNGAHWFHLQDLEKWEVEEQVAHFEEI